MPEHQGNNIWQEVWCRKTGAGCGGFMLYRINANLNQRVKIICPKCKHQHERIVTKGRIIDDGQRGLKCNLTLEVMLDQWSAEPFTEEMKRHCHRHDGSAYIIGDDKAMANQPSQSQFLRESWSERFAGKLFGRH
jgi:hypothetical protein